MLSTVVVTAAQEDHAGAGWPEALPLLPHPAEMIVGLIAFSILYWLYAKFVVPNMERMYAERTDAIEGGMKRAEQAQAEAEEARDTYRAKLGEAREEASRIREEARAEGAQIVSEMREQAQAEAQRITSSAQQQIQAERQQAVVQLRSEVGTMATTLASRIVGESLTDDERASRVVDRFLADLEERAERSERSSDDTRAQDTETTPAGSES